MRMAKRSLTTKQVLALKRGQVVYFRVKRSVSKRWFGPAKLVDDPDEQGYIDAECLSCSEPILVLVGRDSVRMAEED